MPDAWLKGRVGDVGQAAIHSVDEWMVKHGAPRLTNLSGLYPAAAAGWRLAIEVGDQVVQLDLWLPTDFPWAKPSLVLVEKPGFPSFPHVERDGSLCLLPATAEWDTSAPVELVEQLIVDAAHLLEQGMRGDNADDFRTEVQSYWQLEPRSKEVRSLLSTEPHSGPVRVWRGRSYLLVGDDDGTLDDWLTHRFPAQKGKRHFSSGILCWLDQAPLPADFPLTTVDVVQIIESVGQADLLPAAIGTDPDGVLVILGFPTAGGASFLAVEMLPSRSGRRRGLAPAREWLVDGYRHNRVPAALVANRFLTRGSLRRREVVRVDARWVHGRDANDRVDELTASTVAIIGCGSLGSSVARLLAQAGVGGFVLVDAETLTSANTGRHVLGSGSIGASKAVELGARIAGDFPHIFEMKTVPSRWQQAFEREPKLLRDVDLVVSTIGSWTCESQLDTWLMDLRARAIYGWIEPHGVAAQAVLVDHAKGSACFACGMSREGRPLFEVTSWQERTLVQEPACGAFFQPYGAIQLESAARLTAELALDALLGDTSAPVHRVWAASDRSLQRAGGVWSTAWLAVAGDKGGGREVERRWVQRADCAVCGHNE